MPTLAPVDYDPFAAKPKLTPVDHDPFAAKPSFESESQFAGQMDKTYGAGKWRETSGFRDPAHNAAVGGVPRSRHLLGTPDAPGAHDIVIPGVDPRAAAGRLPSGYKALPEGDHLHLSETTKYTPVDHDPFATRPSPAKLTPVEHDPFAPPKAEGAAGSQFEADRRARWDEAMADLHRDAAAFKADPRSPQSLGYTGNLMRAGLEVAGAAFSAPMAVGDSLTRTVAPQGVTVAGHHLQPRDITDIASFAVPVAGMARAGLMASKAGPAIRDAEKATSHLINRYLAPTTVSAPARAAGMIARRARGESQLKVDQDAARLIKAQRETGAKDKAWHEQLIDYIEHRGTRGKAPDAPDFGKAPDTATPQGRLEARRQQRFFDNSEQGKAANTLREIYRGWQARAEYAIRRNRGAAPQFIKDYYAHIWKEDPEKVKTTMDTFRRQGSGQMFRRRSIPTIAEGIAAGLTPKFENAFETTQHYIDNMSRFLTTHDTQASLKETELVEAGRKPEHSRLAYWAIPGTHHPGDVPLNGILTEREPPRGRGGRPAKPGTEDEPRRITHERKALAGPGEQGKLPGKEPPLYEEPGQIGGRTVARTGARPGRPEIGADGEPLRLTEGEKLDVTPRKPGEPAPIEGRADRAVRKQVLYAHPDVARVYNNNISQSLAQTAVGPLYKVLQATNNANRLLQFGLSFAHGGLVGKQGVISEIAGALGSASRIPGALAKGDVGRAAMHVRSAGGALARAPAAPFANYTKGLKFQRQLLRGERDDPLGRAFARAGGQLKMSDQFRVRGAGSFFQSAQRGSLYKDVTASLRRIVGPSDLKGVAGGWERLKGMGDFVGNVIQTVAAPMMEHVVPHAKQGAWLSEMERWRAANPLASQHDTDVHGAKILDAMDDRMGEMLQDNVFWHKWVKEAAQLAATSYSFTGGTIRQVGGGIMDIPKSVRGLASGEGISPRTAYVMALGIYVPLQNAIYQYMKTGKAPESFQDLTAPRTGGTTTSGDPERAAFLGDEKDIYGYMNDPGGELVDKQSRILQFGENLATGKDWRNLPIAPPSGAPPVPGEPENWPEAFAGDFADHWVPMGFQQQKGKKGTAIGPLERAMAIKPAPQYLQNPQRYAAQRREREMRAWQQKIAADKKAQAQEAP